MTRSKLERKFAVVKPWGVARTSLLRVIDPRSVRGNEAVSLTTHECRAPLIADRPRYLQWTLGLLIAILALSVRDCHAQALPSTAQENDISPTGPEAGKALAAELSNLRLEENAKGVLKIRGRDHKVTEVPITAQPQTGDTQWKMIYRASATEQAGAEQLTVVHTTNAPTQYFYAQAPKPGEPLGEPKLLTGAQAEIPLAGSDFWLSDLGFEFFHWPQQIRHKGVIRRDRSCFVLESVNPNARPGEYARVMSWIDKESGAPIEAEAYGTDGKLLKQFEIGSVQKIDGRYEVKDLKMSNRANSSRTTLEFELDSK
jgi:Outer membrane lipoprotein-sorting protein